MRSSPAADPAALPHALHPSGGGPRAQPLRARPAPGADTRPRAEEYAWLLAAGFEHSVLAVLACDVRGCVTAWSPAAERLFGPAEREVLGGPLSDAWKGVAEEAGDLWERGLAGDLIQGAEVNHWMPDGTLCRLRVSMSPVYGGAGAPAGCMAVLEELSGGARTARAAEDALGRERKAYAYAERARLQVEMIAYVGQVLDASFDFLEQDWRTPLADLAYMVVATVADYCAVDQLCADGSTARLVEVCSAGGALERRPHGPGKPDRRDQLAHVLRGESLLVPDLAPEGTGAMDEDARRELRGLGMASSLAVPMVARGRTFGVLTLGVALRTGRRYDREDLVFAQELAKRIAVALDNVHLYHEAQSAARLRDEMMEITTHDLRIPLNVVSLGAGALLRRASRATPAPPEQRQLQMIVRSAEQMQRLLGDLLDVAEIEAGKLHVEPNPCDPASLIHDVLDLYGLLAEERGVALTATAEPGLPWVAADAERIQQVFANLIANAIKFTPPGGRITVHAAAAPGGVRFGVTDTGPGVPEADRSWIFERYRKSRQGSRRTGIGLGLAIARGIVDSHGGSIWMDDMPGEGGRFLFSLPAAGVRRPD